MDTTKERKRLQAKRHRLNIKYINLINDEASHDKIAIISRELDELDSQIINVLHNWDRYTTSVGGEALERRSIA